MIYNTIGKRIFDVILSASALFLASPIILVVAASILIFDPGPIIFRQERIGRFGKPFTFYKFRSMPPGTKNMPSDKLGVVSIGRLGRLLRRTNIDELPQLINILRGDMSIVGPRPPLPSQLELIESRRANGAILCRPGLTGLAQISSFDGMSVVQKAQFDGLYASSLSLSLDIKIILGTFAYLRKPPPVY